MMYQYHFPADAKKQIIIAQDNGDRYMTFAKASYNLSADPHLRVVSKLELQRKMKQQLANHVAIHAYIEANAQTIRTNLAVRLSLRQLLREMQYTEEQIYDYIPETMEEIDAKSQLMLINRDEKLEKLIPDQIDEEHEAYLHIWKQAKDTPAKWAAVQDRLGFLRKRLEKQRKE
jgi:hypothetical protein